MQEIIIFIVGLVAGFLGATVGGGGMVAVPALLFMGFSPQSAVAINKVGDIGAFLSAITQYWKSKKIDWNMAIPIAIIVIIGSILIPFLPAAIIFLGMLIGGYAGAHTALKKGNTWVKNLFALVILLSVLKILFF